MISIKSKNTPRTKIQSAKPAVLASFWWKKNSVGHQSPPTPNRNYTGALLDPSKGLRYSPTLFNVLPVVELKQRRIIPMLVSI